MLTSMLVLGVKFGAFTAPGGRYRTQAGGRYILQIPQSQKRAFIGSSGDPWQSRSYSQFILRDGLRGRRAQWVWLSLFFFWSAVTVGHTEACITFNHSHLLCENPSSPQENSEPRPAVTFLS